MTEAQKVAEAESQRKSQRTTDEKCDRLRAMAERRNVAGVEGLSTEASRLLSRRKSHPLTCEQNS